jgi:hypothetical protein
LQDHVALIVSGKFVESLVLLAEEVPRIEGASHSAINQREALANENERRVQGPGQTRKILLIQVQLLPLLGEDACGVDGSRNEM